MKLQNLKIKGFKSFADKTDVQFDNQITGIVGPNGCGKSNIVDAIRWVIGEHKISALRSESQSGLVFNGSKTRPASAMAEVSLTFDNDKNLLPTDYSTVTVSRKFYKNGDSEYRLNDVVCRLKDIHNLFLDTGVSNDSYAIIELGMVDDIIKDKDNARRKMIEQAAGISIYKTRKKEAQSKLKSTETDLNRIEDLLFEIGGNLKSLESQARKAEKHKKLKEEYKEQSILHAQKSLSNFNIDFQELNRKIVELEEAKIKIGNEIESKETGLEDLKNEVSKKEQNLNSAQKEFNQILHVITKLEQDKQLNVQKLHFQKDKLHGLQDVIKKAKEQIDDTKKEIDAIEKSLTLAEDAYNKHIQNEEILKKELEDKKSKFESAKSKVEEQKKSLLDAQNSKFKYEKDYAVIETSISNLRQSISQEEDGEIKRNQQKDEIQTDKAQKDTELQKQIAELKKLQVSQEELKSKILEQQSQLENERMALHDANRQLDAKQNEYDLLKSMVESLEGYPDSIKFLSKNKEWEEKPTLVSDVILPKEKYKKSIESVLQTYLNYFVTENFFHAKKAIALLQSAKKGKANFFMLDKIQKTQLQSKLSGLTHALDVIEYDEKYKDLVALLLGNVYIDEEADLHQMDLSENYTIVTLEGNVTLEKYSITGGSSGIFEGNKIGRAKNLDKLAKSIDSLQKLTLETKSTFENTQNLIKSTQEGLSEDKINQTKKSIQSLEQEIYGLNTKLENLEKSSETYKSRVQTYKKQLEEHEARIETIKSENKDVEEHLQTIHDKLQELDQQYITTEKDYREVAEKWNVYTVELNAKKSQFENTQESLKLRKQQMDNLQTQIDNNQKEYEVTSQIITDSETSDSAFVDNIEKQVHVKSEKQQLLNQLDQDFHLKKNELSELESGINKIRKNRDNNNELLAKRKEEMNAMRLEVSSLNERMKVEFGVQLDTILNEEIQIEATEEQLQKNVNSIRHKLQNLGEVNPTAIEAFEEMQKRNQFITEQRDDLIEAKENLMKTIAEVEETANTKFVETFEKVRENFKIVFNALFTEDDSCDMKMTQPDNPAETGIEIYARPKGKKPSVITQLSGGEKTLTSTALLFAIYLIKPAPFCILDEVDAPLDDANVEKFTNMIREFSDNSQFIIVTHNKQTMASVDAIYGVTMQEPGVSKLVPVDFRSLN